MAVVNCALPAPISRDIDDEFDVMLRSSVLAFALPRRRRGKLEPLKGRGGWRPAAARTRSRALQPGAAAPSKRRGLKSCGAAPTEGWCGRPGGSCGAWSPASSANRILATRASATRCESCKADSLA